MCIDRQRPSAVSATGGTPGAHITGLVVRNPHPQRTRKRLCNYDDSACPSRYSYRNGGADPAGFDCSGFVYYVFAQHGVRMPRTVLEQSRVGQPVPQDQLEAGDLVFFSTVSAGPSHVAIAIGGDEFVHAPSSVGQVRVERLSSSYWGSRFVGARRVI